MAKSNDGSDLVSAGEETKSAANEESKTSGSKGGAAQSQTTTAAAGVSENGKTYGEDGYRYPQLEFPSTHDDLSAFNAGVKERIETKYASLVKNVHFYLSYLFLETGDYRNAVRHAEVVLKKFGGSDSRLSKKTQFTVM